MTKQINRIIIGSLGLLLLGVGCAKEEETRHAISDRAMKVGVMVPLSGESSLAGESVRRGVSLALGESQSDKYQLVYADSNCTATGAAAAATKLIQIDQVDVIIGDVCPEATLAAAPIAEKEKVVLVSPASTATAISGAGDYIFRTIASNAAQAAFGAQHAHASGKRQMAVLYTQNTYGEDVATALADTFASLGGTVVAREAVDANATDVREQITALTDAQPDVVFLVSDGAASMEAMLRQTKEAGVTAVRYGMGQQSLEESVRASQAAAEGVLVVALPSGTESFGALYSEQFGEAPGQFAAQAYDAMKGVMTTQADGRSLKRALYEVSFEGANGPVDFDAQGDVSGAYNVFMIQKGAFVKQ